MRVSEFALNISNPHVTWSPPLVPSQEFLHAAVQFAVHNKIFPLFFAGCERCGIRLPEEAQRRKREFGSRKRAQMDALRMLVEECEALRTEFLVFKTLKPFDYVPDDIDILLRNPSAAVDLTKRLSARGYNLVDPGTPEVTVTRFMVDTYVQIDIHTRVAAGHFQLFDTEDIWRNMEFRAIDGHKIPVLDEHTELVLEGAYSLLKDMRLTVPALYGAIWASTNLTRDRVIATAIECGLSVPLLFFLTASEILSMQILHMERVGFDTRCLEVERATSLLNNLHRKTLESHCRIPYPYPPLLVGYSYLSKASWDMKQNHGIRALHELILQPSSKGVKILFDYFGSFF